MAVIAGMILIMDYALVPSGYIRYIIHETNNAGSDEGYDNIIIGASHARSAINPVKLDEAGASVNAFNLAIPGETVTDSYYLLMESDRHNNVKRVIRALEYFHQTGKKISEHNEEQSQNVSPYNFVYFVLK